MSEQNSQSLRQDSGLILSDKSKDQVQPKVDINADVVNQYTGEKWYYTDIVKDHFFNPRNLMLEEPDESQYQAIGMVGSPACILPSTIIQTNPSTKIIEDTKVGERVLSHDGYFHPVERVIRPQYDSDLVKIKNPLGKITATKDHLIFAMQVPRKKESPFVHTKYKKQIPVSWVHAGDLQKGDMVLYPVPKEIRNVKEVVLSKARKSVHDFRSRELPRTLKINQEVLELFGYFVAEGHTRDEKEVGFTFGIGEIEYVKRVQHLIKKYFGLEATYRMRKSNNRIDVVVYNIYLAKLFREWFGDSAERKTIPEYILFLDPLIQRGFIRGVWRGDGYFSATRSQPRAGFATISEKLLHEMRWLLLRQRIIPSIYRERGRVIKGVNHQPSFRIHVGDMDSLERLGKILEISFMRDQRKRHEVEVWSDNDFVYLPVRKIEHVPFTGRLYNFEVKQSHTYTTDAFLVHNCGDMMKMWLKIEPETEKVTVMNWRTFGCGSAIAATSMFSVMITENGGLPIDEALKIKPQNIMERLGGLPNRKIHCSVLADKAFRKAANDYFRRTGQAGRVIIDGAKVIDAKLNITDKDIEEAVLEGAVDLDGVQKKLKVGIGSPEVIPEVEQLIRFYKEKYYG